ncbi:MAG: hypothetical protein AB1941_15810 [Gemmatimonadota bacterium]
MSAHPGDPADRRPFPPFAPALSRPSGSPDAPPAAGAPLPPFAPFSRPAAPPTPAAAEPVGVVDEYARTPEPPEAVQEEAAPFTPAAIEAQDEAWMPWETPEDAGTTRSAEPQEEEEDLPWLSAEAPAEAEPAPQEPAAGEVPGWMAWSDEEVASPAPEPEAQTEAAEEPAAGEAYSFDVEAFDPAPLETPVPEEAAFDETPSGLADGEPAGLGADAPFSFAAEPESIAGEPLPYASGEMEPLDAADAFPEARDELAAEEYAPPVHVSEAEAAPEAWSVEFAVDESAAEGAQDAREPVLDEATAGMEDLYAAEENTAAEEALYAVPVADAEYAAGFDDVADFTESVADTEYAAGFDDVADFTEPAADDYAVEYAESAPEAASGFEAPEAESAFAGTGPAAVSGGTADALAKVAERLEGIARRLREQPDEVLAGGAGTDPLELLVTGFALGYAQGRRRA